MNENRQLIQEEIGVIMSQLENDCRHYEEAMTQLNAEHNNTLADFQDEADRCASRSILERIETL